MRMLTDPKLFNYLILLLYILASMRWAYQRSWWDMVYWAGAAVLQVVITFR